MDPSNQYKYNQSPPPVAGSSYASRSVQAYEQQQQQQQQYMQQQQQFMQQLQPPQQQHKQLPPQQPQPVPSQPFQQTQPPIYAPAPPATLNPSQYNHHHQQQQQPQSSTKAYQQSQQSTMQHVQEQNQQQLLEISIRRMQEATHIMRGAMDADDLPTTLDRASAMLGELGDPKHHHHHSHHHNHHYSHASSAIMSPKHYYEIHMLAMEELPNIEEYFLSLSSGPSARYTMKDLYEITQYTSRAVPRLYLQICAGSALIRSGEEDVTVVLNDLIQAVKCVQCPIRGLFLRDYLLKAVRDKLPDEVDQRNTNMNLVGILEENKDDNLPGFEEVNIENSNDQNGIATHTAALSSLMGDLTVNMNESDGFLSGDQSVPTETNKEIDNQQIQPTLTTVSNITPNSPGRVKDSYQFVMANFIEMNKLWVRIQHLPGDPKNKDTKRRRERERNELRMMVGTNLVRLSELEGVTSAIYGTVILPRILDQIVACRDPLAQAYLMDCIIQVFPDEFHIQTLEVILNVCPKLRDKVNIRTILQSIMDRLANYYADELLLNDEVDTDGVKTSVMLDSFEMFDECIRSVLQARGAKINAKEVVRLESSLLDFSLKCYPGRMDHINRCLGVCASCLRGEGTVQSELGSAISQILPMDEVAVQELEKLLSLPLETLGLNILDLDQYSELLTFLPLDHRKRVAMELLSVLYQSGEKMSRITEIEQLFAIISPLIYGGSVNDTSPQALYEKETISKLIHILHNDDTDAHFEILNFVKKHLFSHGGGSHISAYTVSPLFFSAMKLLERVQSLEFPKVDIVSPSGTFGVANSGNTNEKEVHAEDLVQDGELSDKKDNDNYVEEEISIGGGDVKKENELEAVALDDHGNDDVEHTENNVGKDASTFHDEQAAAGTNDQGVQGQSSDAANDSVEVTLTEEDVKLSEEGIVVDSNHQSQSADEKELVVDNVVDNHEKDNESQETPTSDTENNADKDSSPGHPTTASQEAQPAKVEAGLFSNEEAFTNIPIFDKVTNCRKIFLFVQKLLSFVEVSNPSLCFRLRLYAAVTANNCAIASAKNDYKNEFVPITYEFISEAFLTYESEISDSTAQKIAMTRIIGVLHSCTCFDIAEYEALITKTTQYCSRLLKKTDQCSMVLLCSHLFFKDENVYRNPQRVLECLQRSLKLADACTNANPANLQLFVDIFDKYVYFFEQGNPYVTDKFVSGLMALITEHINSIGDHNSIIKDAKQHYYKVVDYIERKKGDSVLGEKFGPIIVSKGN